MLKLLLRHLAAAILQSAVVTLQSALLTLLAAVLALTQQSALSNTTRLVFKFQETTKKKVRPSFGERIFFRYLLVFKKRTISHQLSFSLFISKKIIIFFESSSKSYIFARCYNILNK